jgi:long-chain fatty acid transport protein
MARRRGLARCLVLCLLSLLAGVQAAWAQQGISIGGAGPVNLSFGGASTAAPLDASGALYWNPATLVGLEKSELNTGTALIYPQTRVSSGIAAGSLLPGIPPNGFSDAQRGDNGIFPGPVFAFAYKPEDGMWAVGAGGFPVGTFGVNYPGSRDNLVLSARPPLGIAQGPVYAQLQVFDLVAAGSVRLTDHLSMGFAPVLTLGLIYEDPGLSAIPDSDRVTGTPIYPSLTHTRYAWGAGFHAGMYYDTEPGWRFGLSFRSTQWLETFHYHDSDPVGRPRNDTIRADFPMISSLGVSYAGLEHWLFAADFRYIDYANTKGFSQGGFNPDGSLAGLGWRSIFALALGVQHQLNDSLTLRIGYNFNLNPIPDRFATENVGSAAVEEHTLFLGGTWYMTPTVQISLAYAHVFSNGINGPLVLPGFGDIPGSYVRDEVTGVDAIIAGFSVQF